MVANNKHADTDFLNAWHSLQIKCAIWELYFYLLPVCLILEAAYIITLYAFCSKGFLSVLRAFCKEVQLG